MDALTRSVLERAGRAGVATMSVNPHLAVLRTVLAADEAATLVRTCHRADRKFQGELLLTVTARHLVLTKARFLGGVQPYLVAARAELTGVRWGPHEKLPFLELSFTHQGTTYVLWFNGHQPSQLVEAEADVSAALG